MSSRRDAHDNQLRRGRSRSPKRAHPHHRSRSRSPPHSITHIDHTYVHIHADNHAAAEPAGKPLPSKKVLPWLKKAVVANKNQQSNTSRHDPLSSQPPPAMPPSTSVKPASSAPNIPNRLAQPAPPASTQPYIKEVKLRTVSNTAPPPSTTVTSAQPSRTHNSDKLIEVVLNDRLGKKVRIKCKLNDTVAVLKRLAAAQLGTRPDKLKIQKWYTVYKDNIEVGDYEVQDGMNLELYYV